MPAARCRLTPGTITELVVAVKTDRVRNIRIKTVLDKPITNENVEAFVNQA